MALANGWIVLVAIAVILVAIGVGLLIGLRRNARQHAAPSAPIARAERLRSLPSFRRAVRRRTAALAAVIALGVIATIVGGVVAARPMSSQTIQPVNTNRDIMLCLDVSGSMSDVDVEVLTVFEELLDGFEGERIGLTIFNSSPVQVFPLTDDYEFIRTHLESIRSSFDFMEEIPEHWVGTLNGPGASLIGDGLASCAMRFDHLDDERSRSIILATDNELAGASIVSLDEAASYAASAGIRVFALNPVQGVNTQISDELVAAAQATGGEAYGLRDTTTVADIIADVQKQDATELRGQAQVVWTDTPNLWIAVLLVLGLGFIVLLWRVRLWIFQPVLNVFLLILLFAPVAAVVIYMLTRPSTGSGTGSTGSGTGSTGSGAGIWAMRLVMLLACFAMLLRPGIPGGATQTLATDTDIVIVLDTTASIVAEDWDGDQPRLEGVRTDVQSIVDEYPGARFALITFGAAAEQRLPLTTDTTALISSLDILQPEVTSQSRGSSVGIASTMLEATLAAAAESAPDRSRMVFYLGDGEQTVTTEPESFAGSAEFTDGGEVLGYGTSEGGPMKITSGDPSASSGTGSDGGEYIEYQGAPAMSVLDEANLQAIADELGVPLQLRDAGTTLDLPEAPTTTTNPSTGSETGGIVGNVIELYWIFALLIVAPLGVELTRTTILVTQLRGLAILGGDA